MGTRENMKNGNSLIWPNDYKFALCLTHDVDRIKKTYQYFTHFLKTRRFYHLQAMLQKNEPYWTFEKIIETENKYDVKSTFYFMNETKKFDLSNLSLKRYDIREQKLIDLILKLKNSGWEVGLHGSYNSYKNRNMLAEEKEGLEEIIGNKVAGIRQHYLNLEIPRTWEIGFIEEKYLPFRPLSNRFLVIPLTIMDSALFKNSNNITDAWEKSKDVINQAEKRGALMTVLWHNQVFNEKEYPGWSLVYEKIIKLCKEKGAWVTTAGDIAEWWNSEFAFS